DNKLLSEYHALKRRKSNNANPLSQSWDSERHQNLWLGTLWPTQGRRRPRWSWKGRMETPQMVKRHQIRMDHQRKRIQVYEPQDRKNHQNRTVETPDGRD